MKNLNENWGSFLEGMVQLKDCRTKRISSWDKSGGNHDWISIPA